METRVIYKKKISWLEYREVGLTAIRLRTDGKSWLDFCRKYSECIAHFYDDIVLVQLVERDGQIQVPAAVPYNRVIIECKGLKIRIRIRHTQAHIILPLRERDLKQGDIETLVDLVQAGKKREAELAKQRGFSSKARDLDAI